MGYVAFFCPGCGMHLNEAELDTDEVVERRRAPVLGGVPCGWCHERHDSFDDIVVCRSTHRSKRSLRERQMAGELLEQLGELDGRR